MSWLILCFKRKTLSLGRRDLAEATTHGSVQAPSELQTCSFWAPSILLSFELEVKPTNSGCPTYTYVKGQTNRFLTNNLPHHFEKPSAAQEPPIFGCHMPDGCVHCIYFPEVSSLLILSEVRFQGIPRCFFFSPMLVVRLLQLFRAKWPICWLPRKMMTMKSILLVLVTVPVPTSHSWFNFQWGS